MVYRTNPYDNMYVAFARKTNVYYTRVLGELPYMTQLASGAQQYMYMYACFMLISGKHVHV